MEMIIETTDGYLVVKTKEKKYKQIELKLEK